MPWLGQEWKALFKFKHFVLAKKAVIQVPSTAIVAGGGLREGVAD